MEDRVINFETAKLARECGFKELSNNRYYTFEGEYYFHNGFVGYDDAILAPYQSLLYKWIRDTYDYYIVIQPNILSDAPKIKHLLTIGSYINFLERDTDYIKNYNYEDTMEIGLYRILRLIYKKNIMNLKKKVKKAAKKLVEKNSNVTTKEIKKYLRKKNPTLYIVQATISILMDELLQEKAIKNLTFSDNGVYRTYYIENNKKARPVVSLSRTKIIELIEDAKGQFITLYYEKKDKTPGKTNGQFVKNDSFGYINLRTPKGEIKRANSRTLQQATIKGTKYTVK